MSQSEQDPAATKAAFGFQDVDRSKKASLVRGVFDSVAERYDLMNDVMSLGVHRIWKRIFIDRLRLRAGETLVDVAGGTGDIARQALARAKGPARAVLIDINEAMVRQGANRGVVQGLSLSVGDGERLPFPDKSFDAYTIAFGIRNVTDLDAVLAEARRVLKPGGRFLCLEFSTVTVPGLDRLYDLYSFDVLPRLGAWIAKDGPAYTYLAESIRRFPDAESFAKRIASVGLRNVDVTRLSGGIAAIHQAWRI